MAEATLEADATDDEISAQMTAIAGDDAEGVIGDAETAVDNADQDVRDAEAALANARVTNSDAELQTAVENAQDAVDDSDLYSSLQDALATAENALAADVAADGSNEAVATALFDAIAAFQREGGTFDSGDPTAFQTAYNTAVTGGEDAQWEAAISEAGDLFTVAEDGTVSPSLSGADADLRVNVRSAAKVADERDVLIDDVAEAETNFTSSPATIAQDLGDADLSTGGSVSLSVDGEAATAITFTDSADLVSQLGEIEGVSSASFDADTNTLSVVSSSTGASATLEITASTLTTSDGTSAATFANDGEVTGAASTGLGNDLVTAQGNVEDREGLIEAVSEAEADLVEAQDELSSLTALVEEYRDAGDAVQDVRDTLEDDFGVESLVELEDGDDVGTADTGELFLFSQTDSDQAITIDFESGDQLFIGNEFTLNTEADFSENEGESSVIEAFFVQNGSDVDVQLEQSAFGSNASTQEVDTITLTGVAAEDLSFENGYITVASAAEIA
ncbi:hypothetical protein ACRHM7_13120 [Chromohalobacter israelensis]|uniref:hypothetical protein n=1 Tax=Chromohalobacter israelensis TaxID=141390 RepID=UPI003D78E06C